MSGVLTTAFYPCKSFGAMEVHRHSRISILLVAVDVGQFTRLDFKHKGPLVFESRDNNIKSEFDLTYKNNAIFV